VEAEVKVPAGNVWFVGGWRKWVPVFVLWHVRGGWSFEVRSAYLKGLVSWRRK